MAKKQAGLSDAMSMALIRGEREIGRAQAAKDTAGIKEIFGGIADVVTTSLQKKKKREAKLEAYAEALGGVQNINMLEDDYNKQAVTDFVRTKRDEYNEAAKMYEKTKDAKYRDQMEAVKFSFENLNAQLQGLVQEKAEYMTSFEKKELVHLEGDEKYTDIYTNNSKFSIEQNGDVGFATGTFKDGTNKYHKLKDIAGKWNTKQYDTELLVLQNNDFSFKIAQQGKDFPRDNIKNNYNSTLKQSGPKGIRVMSKTDISGEDQYENLPDDLSFEALWQTGGLLPKFYKDFKAKDGVKWMDDPDNAPMLGDMLSEYLTDVNHYTHRENFKAKREDVIEENKKGELTDSKALIDRVLTAWKSGKIVGLKLPYGRSINYDEESKKYELVKIDGTVIADFTTPDNEILMQILSAHGAQEKHMNTIDFTKPIFKTPDTSNVDVSSFTTYVPGKNNKKDNFRFYE